MSPPGTTMRGPERARHPSSQGCARMLPMALRTTPLLELCAAGLDAVAFRRELRQRLYRLVPFDEFCVNTADPELLLVTSSIGDGLGAAAAQRLIALEHVSGEVNRLAE